jgi:uncharacterized MAPEG superfamily protein
MSREIHWLALTLGATLLFWIPYVLNRMLVRGIGGTLANPSPNDVPLAPWAQRAKAAHANAIENLAVFAPAALAVAALHLGDQTTAAACALYFYSRLVHFLVYTAGIPGIRTLAFCGGWAGSVMLVARLFGLL